jgi:hypothetical protein
MTEECPNSSPDTLRDMSNANNNNIKPCSVAGSHCEQCGRPAEGSAENDGYSGCCNELIVWDDCRNHHGEADAEWTTAPIVPGFEPKNTTQAKQDAALALRNQGWTFKAIAARVGYASSTGARNGAIAAAKRVG